MPGGRRSWKHQGEQNDGFLPLFVVVKTHWWFSSASGSCARHRYLRSMVLPRPLIRTCIRAAPTPNRDKEQEAKPAKQHFLRSIWLLCPSQIIYLQVPYGQFPNPKRTLSEFGGWRKKIARPVRNFPKTKNWIAVSDFPRNVAISRTPRSGGAGGLLVSKVLAHTVGAGLVQGRVRFS